MELSMTEEKLAQVEQLAHRLLEAHGLDNWVFALNGRRRQIARCVAPHAGRPGRIELSRHYALLLDDAALADSLKHEIAHALVGPGRGHDALWRAKCKEIGARPVPCGDPPRMPLGVWRGSCPVCKKTYDFYRRPRTLLRYCAACGPERGALTLARA
jgi:hypothetical protein